ncbi:hypothetical protein KY361_03035 [Candidatus Woesearchaeota archaeon]|nr:hypothetical protein [Candidatus Woesearchaeota archaeon]
MSFFDACDSFERKPRIKKNKILDKDEPRSKKENTPDFKCKLLKRDIIFEITNLQDLMSDNSRLKFNPGKVICYDLTKQAENKINKKMKENFDNIDDSFTNPILLILNVDESDVDPIQVGLVLKDKINDIHKKEILSAVVVAKSSLKKGVLFLNSSSKNPLCWEESLSLQDKFSKKGHSLAIPIQGGDLPDNNDLLS